MIEQLNSIAETLSENEKKLNDINNRLDKIESDLKWAAKAKEVEPSEPPDASYEEASPLRKSRGRSTSRTRSKATSRSKSRPREVTRTATGPRSRSQFRGRSQLPGSEGQDVGFTQTKQWGYAYSTRKGRDLVQVIEHADLLTLNELSSHTRIGVGLKRDTTPDLTLCKNIRHIKWENTFEDQGSYHRILNVSIGNAVLSPTQVPTKLVDWDKFRKNRNDNEQEPITNIEHWNQELLEDVGKATTDVELGGWEEDEQPRVDSRLAHLKQAKRSIQLRLQGQKHNRNPRRKITELNKQIEEHYARLCNQEWDEVCDTLDNNIKTSKTWTIFRRLLDPTNTKVPS
ncbi:hypothetical protein HPB50_027787 [Hyalomma asiaticum]|nr:hypothetical protein HPB50_027787 [Hyalomma asiaticum]